MVATQNYKKFMTAGNATVTLTRKSDGQRFTYKVTAPMKYTEKGGKVRDHEAAVRFVSVLTGQDNENDYQYLGNVFLDSMKYAHGRKSKLDWQAPSAKHFWAAWNYPGDYELHHEGKCGRCGRKLTVPESIESGYGPECQGKVM
jgi:hypothetical protein